MKQTSKLLIIAVFLPSIVLAKADKLKLTSKFAKKYKTLFSKEFLLGPNYAKNFRLVQIGCGASCSHIALIDFTTGKVLDTKISVAESEKTMALQKERVEFQEDSNLLVLRGCLNEQPDKCGTHQFNLKNSSLEKIDFTPVH